MTSILIVKTSSLGDIVQAFHVLNFISQLLPNVIIDWAVEEKFLSIVAAHPLVRHAIPIDRDRLFASLRQIRQVSYDHVFDLQGNSKSALVTLFSRGKIKVGFGFQSVREWPNVLATSIRFNVSNQLNIRLQYLSLISQFYKAPFPTQVEGVSFKMNNEEKKALQVIKIDKTRSLVMICPGSQWVNKQVPLQTMIAFLLSIQKKYNFFFLFMWGNEKEKIYCEKMKEILGEKGILVDKLPLASWQNLMGQMDLMIAVDSSALHLCATTSTPTFSIFGPTSPHIFKPIGERHFAFQGACPYGKVFEKQCPALRSCSTGACMTELSSSWLFQAFEKWWDSFSVKEKTWT